MLKSKQFSVDPQSRRAELKLFCSFSSKQGLIQVSLISAKKNICLVFDKMVISKGVSP